MTYPFGDFIDYNDVKDISTEEYFNNNKFSIDGFNKKYKENDNDTYLKRMWNVCKYIAQAEETEDKRDYWARRWFHEIYYDWWQPAGSEVSGADSDAKISMANCFSKETEFITDKGIKKFLDFNDGDKVNILDNYGSYKEATIKEFGKQNLWKLNLVRNGIYKEVFCTPDHVWRKLSNSNKTISLKSTKELESGDELPYIKRKIMNSNDKSRYICPIGVIHGLVFGDGTFDKSKNTCNLILCDDSKQYEKLFRGFNWHIEYPNTDEDNIRIKYLPSYMKEFPSYNINHEYLLGFIAGWIAADGTIDENGRCSLSNANKSNLEWFKIISESLGIYCNNIRKVRDKSPFDDNKNHKLYSAYIQKDSIFESLFIKDTHKKNYWNYINNLNNNKSKTNWKVLSVEKTNIYDNVWCIEEPLHKNFTLKGGLNTHNCTTINMGSNDKRNNWDNLESIFRNTAYKVAKTAAYRQGLGVDFSAIRPRETQVKNSARESTGATHWMRFIDNIGYFVGQKGRIPAMLFSLSCFTENVQIYTSIGWLYVNEITENFEYYKDNIQIWTENGYKNLTGINTKENQVVYEIKVENDKTIEVTEDHEFEVLNINTNEQYIKQIKDVDSEVEELILFN